MIHYLIVKYVDDLNRNEPKNVGIVAYDGSDAVVRFDGEKEDGGIDLRRVRYRITGSHAYGQWVDYWRTALYEPWKIEKRLKGLPAGDPQVIRSLIASSGDQFFVEEGGEIIHDADHLSLDAMGDDLFRRLVHEPEPPAPTSLKDKSESALARAGAPLADPERFQKQFAVTVSGPGGEQIPDEISYRVKNGSWHYLQEVPFIPDRPRSNKREVFKSVYVFQNVPELREGGAILYDSSDVSASGDEQLLHVLGDLGTLIDVDAPEDAAETLASHLHLN